MIFDLASVAVAGQVGPMLLDPRFNVCLPPNLAHDQPLVRLGEVTSRSDHGRPSAGHTTEHVPYLSDPYELDHGLTVGTADCRTIDNSDQG
ncbi:hypothetical protein [Micromonospora psammae]|uniref:hypothetical protein n=1 Tax=Micromonospora sp. CPCC 205556 TaxID=3122398 RepID=UPI002FEF6D05